MRISDWSSDVCSSDLVNDAPEVASDTAVVVKGAALAITPAILSASDAEVSDPGLITFTVSNQVAGMVLLSGLAAASFTLADIEAGLVNFRSEEHTSELQSLMRISYAVFCLKKKNKKIKQKITNRLRK